MYLAQNIFVGVRGKHTSPSTKKSTSQSPFSSTPPSIHLRTVSPPINVWTKLGQWMKHLFVHHKGRRHGSSGDRSGSDDRERLEYEVSVECLLQGEGGKWKTGNLFWLIVCATYPVSGREDGATYFCSLHRRGRRSIWFYLEGLGDNGDRWYISIRGGNSDGEGVPSRVARFPLLP